MGFDWFTCTKIVVPEKSLRNSWSVLAISRPLTGSVGENPSVEALLTMAEAAEAGGCQSSCDTSRGVEVDGSRSVASRASIKSSVT